MHGEVKKKPGARVSMRECEDVNKRKREISSTPGYIARAIGSTDRST